jgi:hypothetical protein
VFEHIMNILAGKKGFLSGKFGSRRVFGTTRNVISSMEVDSELLGGPRQPDMNTTINGVFQFMKGAEPIIRLHALKNYYLKDFYDNIDNEVMLIDRKTLKPSPTILSSKTLDKWGTQAGLESTINGFKDPKKRHKPVLLDGKFLKLIYQDDKYFKVFNSIDEVPDGWDKTKVRGISWCELFYLHAMKVNPKVRCYNTRYPVTGLGSIYPNKVYIKTTTIALDLEELDDNWNPSGVRALEFPDTVKRLPFHDTMVVHPVYLPGLGADFDGDTLSCSYVYSDEGVAEVDKLLGEKTTYISPDGGLTYGSTNDVSEWCLSFMTGNGL